MADSILRLKVDSQEYDNKLKRAAEGLQRYADGFRKAGGTLEHLDDGVEEFVKELGKMETTANSARGKLSEMTKVFTDLSVQYKELTDAEKQSPYGKALAASLDTLKGRIQESKGQLDEINKSINGGGGLTSALDGLANKFGVSIQQLAEWGTAMAAAKGALEVAKDAFFASEASVDEWGRVMDSSKSLYEGFLTSLNTGDITGYLSRIDQIVNAARAAYDELDRLGTMKTIQAPKMSAQQTENDRMRMMIQTGRYIAPIDGRKASMQNGQLLTAEQIKRIEKQLENGMKSITSLIGNEVTQTTKAIHAVYTRQGAELGMSVKEFKKGTSSMDEFDKRMAGYDQYQKWRAEHTTIDMQSGRETVARGNPFEQFAKWGVFRVDGESYNELVKLIQQRNQQAGQAYSMQSQAYRTMNRAEGVTVSKIMNGETTSGGGGGKDTIIEPKIDDFNKIFNKSMLNTDSLKALEPTGPSEAWKAYVDSIKQGSEEAGNSIDSLVDAFERLNKSEGVDTTKDLPKDAKVVKGSFNDAASAVGGLGSALAGLDDPGAKIAGTIAQAIANIALAFSSADLKEGESGNIWYWITATAAGAAAMISTIASIHSATGYQHGGMVKGLAGGMIAGSTYSNDQIPIMANAGEVVLTKAMQGNLASVLSDQERGGGMSMSRVSGEQIYVVLDRYMRRSGRGEILTWK